MSRLRKLSTMSIALIAAVTITNAALAAKGGGGKPPEDPTPPPSGSASKIAFNRIVKAGKGKDAAYHLHVIVASPDGSDPVRITDSGTNYPLSWSNDGWMLITTDGTYRILDVPPEDPSAASDVTSFTMPSGSTPRLWSAHSDASGVLPATQQRLLGTIGSNGTSNIVVWRYDGTDPVAVTSYVSTCVVGLNPGCTGSRYETLLGGWLPTDAAADTISVVYVLTERTYVGGVETGQSVSYRVAALDTSAWPATSVVADDPVVFVGVPPTAWELTVSRDGTLVAYKNAGGDPFLTVAPLEYDGTAGTVTWRADLAQAVADVTPLGYGWAVYRAGGFSPDNSRLVIDGLANTAPGLDNPRPSVLVADATTDAPPTDVDGDTDRQAGSSIWSP